MFNDYINTIYALKSSPDSTNTKKYVAKSMLNNLLGRFGMSLHKSVTDRVTQGVFNTLACIYSISDLNN